MSVMEPEDLVECPFDKTHMIRNKRLQYHITECVKSNPNHNMKKCPFNARHWVPKPHFQHHISTCPDKRNIEAEMEYQSSLGSKNTHFGGNVSVPSYETKYVIDETENWDDEATAAPFVFGQTKGDQRNTSNTEHVFIHPAERNYIPTEIRLPKQAPRVLQGSANISGYGRGAMVAKAKQEQNVAALQSLGRGRGKPRTTATQPGINTQSFSDVMGQHTSNQGQQGHSNVVTSQSLYSNSDNHSSSQLYVETNGGRTTPVDSPYSSGSDSPTIPSLARKQGRSIQPRSINVKSRFSPSSSRDGSPLKTPAHTGEGNIPSWIQPTAVNAPKGYPGGIQPREVNAPKGYPAGIQPLGVNAPRGVTAPPLWLGRGRAPASSDSSPSPQQTQAQQIPVMRGIGRGIIRSVNVSLPSRSGFDSTGSNSPKSYSDSDTLENEIDREKLKDERKIRKKLKQIEALEERLQSGQTLTGEENIKLSQKKDLLAQMDDLKLS